MGDSQDFGHVRAGDKTSIGEFFVELSSQSQFWDIQYVLTPYLCWLVATYSIEARNHIIGRGGTAMRCIRGASTMTPLGRQGLSLYRIGGACWKAARVEGC